MADLNLYKWNIPNEDVWELTTKPNDIWCRDLISKYGRNNYLHLSIPPQPYDSPMWPSFSRKIGTHGTFIWDLTWLRERVFQTNYWK